MGVHTRTLIGRVSAGISLLRAVVNAYREYTLVETTMESDYALQIFSVGGGEVVQDVSDESPMP